MNTNISETVEISSAACILPQRLGFENVVVVNIRDVIKELAEDPNGMVTNLGSYLASPMSFITLKQSCFCSNHIFQCLREFINDHQFCQILSEMIAIDCAAILPETFILVFVVKVTREVRITLPSVTVPSKAASSDVFQRLVEEHTVESIDLGDEEQTSCSVCLENLSGSSSEKIIRLPICLHLFHQDCIFEWLRNQNSCPLCRRVPYQAET